MRPSTVRYVVRLSVYLSCCFAFKCGTYYLGTTEKIQPQQGTAVPNQTQVTPQPTTSNPTNMPQSNNTEQEDVDEIVRLCQQ